MQVRRLATAVTLFLLVSTSIRIQPAGGESAQTTLASHWVPGWGFRDQLNQSDIDYQNFWTDNAGKILTSGILTNGMVDASRALGFIKSHMTASYYLPEVLVNSSIIRPQVVGESDSLTNRIVMMGANDSRSELQQLSIGDYYAGPWTAGYLGADRIWYNGSAHRANSSTVTAIAGGFAKRAFFSFGGVSFYTYLNATIAVGDPYVEVSIQVMPLTSTFGQGDHIYLQVFAGAKDGLQKYAFENAKMFETDGTPVGTLPFRQGAPQESAGMLFTYSNRTNILDQDSVALKFNATGIQGVEHWYLDGAFGNQSWVGLEYGVPSTGRGQLSAPVFAEVYPIEHLDFRLLSDTAKYVASNPKEVAVSPPVSFGFVARGLALASNDDPGNQTLRKLAAGYWNHYFGRYQGTRPDRAYARATSVLALAGFELNGGNSTVENFTRTFVGGFSGASIEERAWSAAALWTLFHNTGSLSDLHLLQDAYSSYVPGGNHFVQPADSNARPNDTFEFAETASGLLSGGLAYNSSAVLWAMDAVFQSNMSGVLLNRPFHGDLANTETTPAIMLADSMFTDSIRSGTGGYWIDWVQRTNITAVQYAGGRLELAVKGDNGTVAVGTPAGVQVYGRINGPSILVIEPPSFPWVPIGAVLLVLASTSVFWYLYRRKHRMSREIAGLTRSA